MKTHIIDIIILKIKKITTSIENNNGRSMLLRRRKEKCRYEFISKRVV